MGQRDNTHETLLLSAQTLFLRRGISGVSMEDIAQNAGCTRRTLYRYFTTREQLITEVIIRLLDSWNTVQDTCAAKLEGAGINQLETFLRSLASFFHSGTDMLRVFAEFDFLITDAETALVSTDTRSRFLESSGKTGRIIEKLMKKGIDDGSIKANTDQTKIIPAVSVALWSSAQREARSGRLLQEEFGISAEDVLNTQITLLIHALRS